MANVNKTSDIPAFNPVSRQKLREGLRELMHSCDDLMGIHSEHEDDD